MFKPAIIFLAATLAAPAAMGAAQVTDATPTTSAQQLTSLMNRPADYDAQEQIRALQEEVQMLRGLVEENQHEITTLNQRQRELYADLDDRLSRVKQTQSQALPPATAVPSASATDSESKSYQSAYDALKNKHYSQAIQAFDAYLADYPQGQYSANAYYWLGETHIIHDDLASAQSAFKHIVTEFPAHQKAPDALLKLGYVYDAAGEKEKALETLGQVKAKYPQSSVAKLAEQRILDIRTRG